MIFMLMKNDNTIISFNLAHIVSFGVIAILACTGSIVYIYHVDVKWYEIAICVFLCIVAIYSSIEAIIIDYSVAFDNIGFTIIERNRMTSYNQIKSYKWKEIKELYFRGIYARFSPPIMTIVYKKGGYDEVECSRITYKLNKFIKFAQYYSGCDGIVRSNRKRKPFEKDW